MPSTFFGLNTAYTGLIASNASINTAGNNIANVETKGYSRQTVTQQASDAIRTHTTYGCAGAGVDTKSIDRNRDAFYDFKYWNNNDKVGEYGEKEYYMKQIEDLFADDNKTIKGFTTVFNELSEALAELQKNPGDVTTKSQMIGFAITCHTILIRWRRIWSISRRISMQRSKIKWMRSIPTLQRLLP